MKRICTVLAVLLALLLTLSFAAAEGPATSGDFGDGFHWSLSDGGTLTVTGAGAMPDFDRWSDVPWYLSASRITAVELPEGLAFIGSHAFEDCTSLTKITIPGQVTSIGSSVFKGCSALTTVRFPASLTEIGGESFSLCSALTGIYYEGSVDDYAKINNNLNNDNFALLSATIYCGPDGEPWAGAGQCSASGSSVYWKLDPDGNLTFFGEGASRNIGSDYITEKWSGVKTLTVEQGVTALDSGMFYCPQMTEATLPDGLTSIGAGAFRSCGLQKITLPASLERVGDWAFKNCNALTDVFYPGTLAQWQQISVGSENDCLTKNAVKHCSDLTFQQTGSCGDLTWVFVDGKLTVSGEGAIPDSSSSPWSSLRDQVKEVELQEGVTGIGQSAFNGLSGLEKVTIRGPVASIGQSAFSFCTSLTAFTVPEPVTTLEPNTFMDCSALTTVRLPAGLTQIKSQAFYRTSSLAQIYFGGSVDAYAKIAVASYNDPLSAASLYCGPEQELWAGAGACGANDSNVFWKLDIAGNLTVFGKGTVKTTDALRKQWTTAKALTIEEGITALGHSAFRDLTGLTTATLPDTLTSFDYYAFSATGLTEITIPASLTEIGGYAFQDCAALKLVNLSSTLTRVAGAAFKNCAMLKDIRFDGTWEQYCTVNINYDNAPLNAAVKHCTDGDFYAAGTCGNGLTWILDATGTLTVSGSGYMQSFTPYLGTYAPVIRRISLPAGLTGMSGLPFRGCSSLAEIQMADGCEKYWAEDGVLYGPVSSYRTDSALVCYPPARPGSAFTVPEDVTAILTFAFEECSVLEELNLSPGVTGIESSGISRCPSLTKVLIPHTVSSIKNTALTECPNAAIWGYDETEAEAYALENGIPWHSMGEAPRTVVYITLDDENWNSTLEQALKQSFVRIVFADGVYRVNPLRIQAGSHLTLEAEHPGKAELLCWSSMDPVVTVSSAKHVTLRGLILGHTSEAGYVSDCYGPGGPGSPGGDVIRAYSAQDLEVDGCDLWGCGIVAVRLFSGNTDVLVHDSILRDCVESAVVSQSSDAAFVNCIISGNAYKNQDFACLRVNGNPEQLHFTDCVFFYNRNPALCDAEVPDNMFENCEFHDNAWQGAEPGLGGVCLGGVTWQAVPQGESTKTLHFGGTITFSDGGTLASGAGEIPNYSYSSKPWKRIGQLLGNEVTAAPGVSAKLPADALNGYTIRLDSLGMQQGETYMIVYALYDADGRMFDLNHEQVTVDGETAAEIILEGQPTGVTCRIFVLTPAYSPVTDVACFDFVG